MSSGGSSAEPTLNEVAGSDYHFVDADRFLQLREAGQFAEWAEVHGNLYGTAL